MTKLDIVRMLAKKYDVSQLTISHMVSDIFNDIIPEAIARDGSLTLVGFGRWTVRNVKERQGRNPRTGEAITVKAHKTVRFHAGSNLLNKATKTK